jgi:hypothetical protein
MEPLQGGQYRRALEHAGNQNANGHKFMVQKIC